MQFDVACDCGEKMTVSEGSAGVTRTCRCGRAIKIPSLDELRRLAGVPEPTLSPEMIVEALLLAGKLPEENHCVLCGNATTDSIVCRTECTRAYVESGRQPWWVYLLGFLTFGWLGVAAAAAARDDEKEVGKDRTYDLPLRVCVGCKPKLADSARIRFAMQLCPLYASLLEKYPKARIELYRFRLFER